MNAFRWIGGGCRLWRQRIADREKASDKPEPTGSEPLKQRVDELERRVATLEAELERPQFNLQAAKQALKPRILMGATLFFALVPPLLVVRDRWLGHPLTSPLLSKWWRRLVLLPHLGLPPYFLFVLLCFLGLLALMWYNKKEGPLVTFSNLSFGTSKPVTVTVSPLQSLLSRTVLAVAGLGLLLLIVSALLGQRVLGWDFALVLLLYLLGWALREIPLAGVTKFWRQNRELIVTLSLAHVALVAFLANVFSTGPGKPVWIFLLLLALATLNLICHYRQVSPIFWIASLALTLFTLNINAWWVSMVGDEYSFFDVARYIAEQQSLSALGTRLFDGRGVYGGEPYLSSVRQAVFMKLLGSNNFGWRFSNVYLSAMAIVFFFFFFQTFVPRRIALLTSFLLATSQYLMAFSKIGYCNLQALWAMSLVLAATAWALRTARPLAFVVLGLTLGNCFYVFPAAWYAVPLPVLLLLLYDPPTSKAAIRRWSLLTLSMFLLIFPLLLQPAYWWATKQGGTFLSNPEIMTSLSSILDHLATNLVYALVSFVYIMEESHFVAASYVDPLSAVLVAVGIAYLLKCVRKTRSALFFVLSFAMLLFLVGASHGAKNPAATRMFLLLPWFALFAAIGLVWIQHQLSTLSGQQIGMAYFTIPVLVAVLVLNLYQAYGLSKQRMERHQYIEALYLRTAMHAQKLEGEFPFTFVFITDPEWSIDGLKHYLQRVYSVPASPAQLVQVTVTDPSLPESARALVSDSRSLVIIKPWLDAGWKSALESSLRELGKVSCDVKTVKGTVRFQVWHSGGLDILCE